MSETDTIGMGHQLYAAETYLTAGNADAAIETVREILKRLPDDVDALEILARGHLAKNDNDGADAAARELLAAAPDSATAHRLLAITSLGKKKKDLAKEEARKAIELEPYEAANHLTLALVCEQRDEFIECEKAYKESLELYPEYTVAKAHYADFLLARGRLDEAKLLLEEASSEAPGDSSVVILRGNIALRDGRIDEAYGNALWALQQDAMDPQAIQLMAQVKMRKNPILGIWWRYAAMMGRFTRKQQIFICIGIYFAWQFAYRGFLKNLPPPIPLVSALIWISFCILTWVGPGILRRMINKELKSIEIKNF
jgi:tetratricopeptide (TPR) repeat protein